MKLKNYSSELILLFLVVLCSSCEDMLMLDTPNNKLVREEVFRSEATAKSAMTGIYNELFQKEFSSGSRNSITLLSGLSADNIRNINTSNVTRMEFEQNEINPDNPDILNIWASGYNMIYMTNSFLEGLESSTELEDTLKRQLEGEAKFVRAFTYFYLVNLYGDVPLILSSDYRDNQLAERSPKIEVYEQIVEDLQRASEVLDVNYENGERTNANKFAAKALLARVYLYMEEWQMAENISSEVISESATYKILEDLDSVFLANSREAIWQISPIGGGGMLTQTNEGNIFIIDPIFSFLASIQLEDEFVNSFEEQDKRRINWIGFHTDLNVSFAYKYKIRNSSEFPIKEYSMVLRLAEQYLIRAESLAMQGKLTEAITDLDILRNRAGLPGLSESNPGIAQEELLDEIFIQRRKELFAEWGHRWLDLNRSGRASEVLSINNPLWENTDRLYPIPSEERQKNPNLTQNEGY